MKPFYKFTYVFWPFCMALCLYSCRKHIDKDGVIVAIEKEFTVQLIETLSSTDNGLALVVLSVNNQECGQTGIKSVVSQKGQEVVVSLQSLRRPPICDGKPAPAKDTIALGVLNKGSYAFQLNLKDVIINRGTLVVDEEGYTLAMDKEDGFSLTQRVLRKMPKNLIWGYVAVDNAAQLDVFMDHLSPFSAVAQLPWGHYGFFNIRSGQFELLSKITSNKSQKRLFCLRLTAPKAELGAQLQTFMGNTGFDFYIMSSEGEVFSNL